MSEREFENALKAIGLDDSESKILSILMDGKTLSASEVISETEFSRGKVYQVLSDSVERGILRKSVDLPGYYSVTDDFLEKIKVDLNEIMTSIFPSIDRVKKRSTSKIHQDVLDTFQEIGYNVIPITYVDRQKYNDVPFFNYFKDFFDYVIEGEYRFCLSFIDKGKLDMVKNILKIDYVLSIIFIYHRLNCISSIIILDEEMEYSPEFKKLILEQMNDIPPAMYPLGKSTGFPRYIGIEDLNVKLIDVVNYQKSNILEYVEQIQNKKILVDNITSDIRNKLEKIENIMVDSEARIRNLLDPGYVRFVLRYREKKLKNKAIQIHQPIIEIVSREKINLQSIKYEFRRFYVKIYDYLESIWARLYLPSSKTLNDISQELDKFMLKFNSIHYEIQSLYGDMRRRPSSRMKKDYFNPFLITIPFEHKGPYLIDQSSAKDKLVKVLDNIVDGREGVFSFISAEPGMGKSHFIQNLIVPSSKKRGVIPITINCKSSLDLIKTLLNSLSPSNENLKMIGSYLHEIHELNIYTIKDLSLYLQDITSILDSTDYKGIVFILDEFENLLQPMLFMEKQKISIEPLVIRQLRELLSNELINIGFIISCRKKVCSIIEGHIEIKNFNEFVLKMEVLALNDIRTLINHRYNLWETRKIKFSKNIIKEIMKITNGNTRDVLKYLRELYRYGEKKDRQIIRINDLKIIQPIPLFKD